MDVARSLNTALAGRYVIESEIGRGGMATVYLARDVRHDRQVALKLLNPELGAVLGVERFLSEIKVTANLHHPNLLPLFDSGEADGLLFYVMPFVAGESLRHRLDREKQLPVDEAIRIASAIASALAYAHAHGVIHRDLKPENILLQEGQPLVADFGIALAVSNAGGARITQTGLSLGTPQYKSPEQATGDRTIDARSDIYSLGAILYEMLTGEPPHIGTTAQAIIARVLTERPRSARASRPSVPEHVDAAIDRALEKLPADRWIDARAFADALHSAATIVRPTVASASTATHGRRWISFATFAVVSLVLCAASVFATLRLTRSNTRSEARVVRYVPQLPQGSELGAPVSGTTTAFSFSPDGKFIVYSARPAGSTVLVKHALNELESRVIPGTVSGLFPKYSPNGKWVAFSANGMLKKTPSEGGAIQTVLDLESLFTQFDWLDDSTFVFARTRDVLWTVPASGGTPKRIGVQSDLKEEWQQAPRALGDGDLVLYSANRGAALDGRMGVFSVKRKKSVVFQVLAGAFPVDVVDNKLIYIRPDGALMAAPFDRASLTVGTPVQVADGIQVQSMNASVAISRTGDLAYIHGATRRQLVVVDDHGVANPMSSEVRAFAHPRLSPDGKRVAFEEARAQVTDIWVFDPAGGGTFAKVTSGGINDRPEWTPDGTRLLYSSNRTPKPGATSDFAPWSQVYDGSTPPVQLYEGKESIREVVPTPDGRSYVVRADATSSLRDIFFLSAAGEKPLLPLVVGSADELMPRVSPDGRWLAYVSDESGAQEVYVRPLGQTVGRIAVSSGGGTEPVWAHHGTRLFYRNRGQMVEASLVAAPTLAVAARRVLFDANYLTETFHPNYDVMSDDKSFVMLKPVDEQRRLVVVLNWREELASQFAGRK